MKTPPGHRETPLRAVTRVPGERDRRFLFFAGIVLVAIALGFKSELLGPNQVWALGLGLIVVAAPAILAYLRSDEPPAVEHYIPVALGAITLAGLAILVPELWKFGLLTVLFGLGFVLAGRLDYLPPRTAEKPGPLVVQEAILASVLAAALLVVVTLP